MGLSTTPILGQRDGRVTYCSPNCGFHCRKSDHDYCVESAQTLANLMGDGWEPRVWENCGWHYSVSKGCAHIHPRYIHSSEKRYIRRGYTCFFNSKRQEVVSHDDPRAAFRDALSNHLSNIREMAEHADVFV